MAKENSWDVVESRPGFARFRGGETFVLLPKEERQPGSVGCSCLYCSPDGHGSVSPEFPVWDTRATSPDGKRTWLVHMPEIDPERVKLRKYFCASESEAA